jgi:molecular chaperone GrpE
MSDFDQNSQLDNDNIPEEMDTTPATYSQANTSSTSDDSHSDEINALLDQVDEWKNRSLRLAADMQNQTKQNELDIQQARKSSKKYVVQLLVGFLNTLNLAFTYAPKTDDESVNKFIQTLSASFEQLKQEFDRQEIEILIPKIGDEFNPEWMAALNDSNEESSVVTQVVSIGLKVDGQIVNEASVLIGELQNQDSEIHDELEDDYQQEENSEEDEELA